MVVDEDRKIVQFEEKQSGITSAYANAGIYLLNRKLFPNVSAATQTSIECELFPRWLAEGRVLRAFVQSGPCIDIGTPERYQKAQAVLAAAEAGYDDALIATAKKQA